jgi:hypothetical protein
MTVLVGKAAIVSKSGLVYNCIAGSTCQGICASLLTASACVVEDLVPDLTDMGNKPSVLSTYKAPAA